MNLNNCQSTIEQAKSLNVSTKTNISETDRFIAEIEKKYGIDSSVAVTPQSVNSTKPIVSDIEISGWHELVSEAKLAYPDKV